MKNKTYHTCHKVTHNKGNNKTTELRTIVQRESQNISGERTTFSVKRSLITYRWLFDTKCCPLPWCMLRVTFWHQMLSVPLIYVKSALLTTTFGVKMSLLTYIRGTTTFGVKMSLITYIRGTDNIWCQNVTHNKYQGSYRWLFDTQSWPFPWCMLRVTFWHQMLSVPLIYVKSDLLTPNVVRSPDIGERTTFGVKMSLLTYIRGTTTFGVKMSLITYIRGTEMLSVPLMYVKSDLLTPNVVRSPDIC
jgi:hypothetical protein